uniref:Uncharacterized protein n=1 Tax=Daphnia galeata TaxID=27404 RepID=A0A8J2R9Y4_9CRUS|nr:unnamed protein product [Daphnia galeata]
MRKFSFNFQKSCSVHPVVHSVVHEVKISEQLSPRGWYFSKFNTRTRKLEEEKEKKWKRVLPLHYPHKRH